MIKPLPPSAVLADIICDNSDGDVLHDIYGKCAKCKRELKGEAALVGTEVWCHPCADEIERLRDENATLRKLVKEYRERTREVIRGR